MREAITESAADLPPAKDPHATGLDRVYAALRVAAMLAGVSYAYVSPLDATARQELVIIFGVFAGYSLLFYVGGWTLFQTHVKGRFYTTMATADLIFLVVLMHMTGGVASPFFRGLYVWVAMMAFYFGQRGGNVSSGVAFAIFILLFATSASDPWDLAVRSGGLLLHGPLIGYLVDRERRREAALHAAERRLEALERGGRERRP